jgi:murein DD-endopeptidase MepM/ murein hydrolase activator NlpD
LLAVIAAAGIAVSVVPVAHAQTPPLFGTSTTTAPPEPAPEQSAPQSGDQTSGDQLTQGAAPAPAGAQDTGGDGAPAPRSGIAVPPEAQVIIDSVRRTGSSSSSALLARMAELEALGISHEDALKVGFGRFPIAGDARYSHDWLFPRYGPGFRFHLGTDVFAAHGTPVRAPVDGVARSANSGLGGLTVKVVMPDGTYFYLAHLSGLAEGFVDGMPVATGDIVGYVGDSGNARGGAPHLHIGVYPKGGPPVDPKPILDQFLVEADARIPEVVAALQSTMPAPEPAPPVTEPPAAIPAEVFHPFVGDGASLPAELLYVAATDARRGTRVLVELALDEMAAGIDWGARSR